MAGKILQNCRIAASGNFRSDWTPQKMKNWIENAGGTFHSHLKDDTTHLLVTKDGWQSQNAMVLKALETKTNGQDIKILCFTWLDNSLWKKRKASEKSYIWKEKLKAGINRVMGDANNMSEMQLSKFRPKSVKGLMAEVFEETTERYAEDQENLKDTDDESERGRGKGEAKEAPRMSKKEQEAIFGRGAKKSRYQALIGAS